jgi:hypothetical protein
VARRNGEEQQRTLEIDWAPQDLERLLQQASGDAVTLVFDGDELERWFEADVEAHGIREVAATFAVMAAAATAVASHASAAPLGQQADGGSGGTGTPIAMVSDAGSGGYTTAAAPELVSDNALTGPVAEASGPTAQGVQARIAAEHATQASATSPEMISDAASSGPVPAAPSPELVSDSALTGPVQGPPEMVSDAASTGPVPAQPGVEMVSDAASSGPAQTPEAASSGGGFSISAPDASTTGAIAGGAALLILAAGFAVRGQRRQAGQPAT